MCSIVIYEADDLMRGLLQEWLTGAGYRVSAVTACGPAPPEADLVIVNIEMPKHMGSRVADKIRAAHPGSADHCDFRSISVPIYRPPAQLLRHSASPQVIAKPPSRDALLGAVSAIIDPAN